MAEGRAPTGHSDGAWQEKGNGGTNKFQGSYLLEDEFRPSWLEDKGLNSTTGRYTSYCKWCGVGFKTNKTTIDDHEGTARHKKQLDEHKKKVAGRHRMGNAFDTGHALRQQRLDQESQLPELACLFRAGVPRTKQHAPIIALNI